MVLVSVSALSLCFGMPANWPHFSDGLAPICGALSAFSVGWSSDHLERVQFVPAPLLDRDCFPDVAGGQVRGRLLISKPPHRLWSTGRLCRTPETKARLTATRSSNLATDTSSGRGLRLRPYLQPAAPPGAAASYSTNTAVTASRNHMGRDRFPPKDSCRQIEDRAGRQTGESTWNVDVRASGTAAD